MTPHKPGRYYKDLAKDSIKQTRDTTSRSLVMGQISNDATR